MDAVEGGSKTRTVVDTGKWTVDDVCKWVVELGLDQYKDRFSNQHIDGAELQTLNHHTLQTALNIGKDTTDSTKHR